jgi:hypothetical protein
VVAVRHLGADVGGIARRGGDHLVVHEELEALDRGRRTTLVDEDAHAALARPLQVELRRPGAPGDLGQQVEEGTLAVGGDLPVHRDALEALVEIAVLPLQPEVEIPPRSVVPGRRDEVVRRLSPALFPDGNGCPLSTSGVRENVRFDARLASLQVCGSASRWSHDTARMRNTTVGSVQTLTRVGEE